MKLLSLVLFMFSFNAFSDVKTISLTASDELKVSCPQGNVAELNGSSLKCVCPKGTYGHVEGKTLRCESICLIEVKDYKVSEYCDQGGCSEEVNHMYLTVTKNGTSLYAERVYSLESREIEIFLPDAISVAKKACFKTFYKGKEIQ